MAICEICIRNEFRLMSVNIFSGCEMEFSYHTKSKCRKRLRSNQHSGQPANFKIEFDQLERTIDSSMTISFHFSSTRNPSLITDS